MSTLSTDTITGEVYCPSCGAPGVNVNVEAFEVFGDAVCDDCASALFEADDEAKQAGLDQAWRAVDACGGNYSPAEQVNGFATAHAAALDAAIAAIEQLGGRPS